MGALRMKLKILHLITRLDRGGSAFNTLDTCAYFIETGHRVVLVSGPTNDPDGTIGKYMDDHQIPWVIIPQIQRSINPFKEMMAFLKLFSFIKKHRFDIVHTHTSKAGILGRFAAWLNRVPVIIHTPHGHIFYGYFSRMVTQIFIVIEKLAALVTDKIITLTDHGKEEHIRFHIANPDKFVPIYSGINIPEFKRNKDDHSLDVRNTLDIPPQAPVIGTVTRLVPIKGIEDLIKAVPTLLEDYPDLRVLLVGDGHLRSDLEELCELVGVRNHIHFLGEQKKVVPFLKAMDVFVLSSINEGMGRCLLEALVCGKPAVATRVGGVPELVEHGSNGFLVPPRQPQLLARAIIEILSDEELKQKMGKNAIKKVTMDFSVEVMVKKIERLYQSSMDDTSSDTVDTAC